MSTKTTVTRYIGNCQICDQDQKLHNGKMVHHGYERPGIGQIVGDCPGVQEDPYEASCDLIKKYNSQLKAQLPGFESRLADIEANRVISFSRVEGTERHQYALGVSNLYVLKQALSHLKYEQEQVVRTTKREIERTDKRIANWVLKPLRTIEEEEAKKAEAKALRKAEVEANREIRRQEAQARKERAQAIKARKQAIRDEFAVKFQALAEKGDRDGALKLFEEMAKKKYRSAISSLSDLKCDDALIVLGLAEFSHEIEGRVYYSYKFSLRY